MLFFVNQQVRLSALQFGSEAFKEWQTKGPMKLLQVPNRLASILQQDDMVKLIDLTNTSLHRLPSAYSIKRHPLRATISLSIGSTVIKCLLVGVTAMSKVCNVNEIQVLL